MIRGDINMVGEQKNKDEWSQKSYLSDFMNKVIVCAVSPKNIIPTEKIPYPAFVLN
ncbi:hypothetical protein ig2599ANME_0683 [groundwater metagenome]